MKELKPTQTKNISGAGCGGLNPCQEFMMEVVAVDYYNLDSLTCQTAVFYTCDPSRGYPGQCDPGGDFDKLCTNSGGGMSQNPDGTSECTFM